MDVSKLNPAVGTPGHKALCNEFRAIVEPNRLRSSTRKFLYECRGLRGAYAEPLRLLR
ncbi:MAG: hypothetical protein LZF62_340236 [Nitrospira sp.]|nr:MAG: hypothetical protein LZF62_340236 [Nitrospira sp.]